MNNKDFRGNYIGHISVSKETGKQLWNVSYKPKAEYGDVESLLVSAFKGTDGIYLNWMSTVNGTMTTTDMRLSVKQVAYVMRILTDAMRWADTERPTWYEASAISEANQRRDVAEKELARVRRTLWARFNEVMDRARERRDRARTDRRMEKLAKRVDRFSGDEESR